MMKSSLAFLLLSASLSVAVLQPSSDMTLLPSTDGVSPDISTYPVPSPLPSPMVQTVTRATLEPDGRDDFNMTMFTYYDAGRLAREVHKLTHPPGREFLGTHMYFIHESPTARAVSEYMDKVDYAKKNGGVDCLDNGEEQDVKHFRKRLAEVVWICEAGWRRNAEFVAKAKSLMAAVVDLDKQASEALQGCKPGQPCYNEFKQSALAASINSQLREMRMNQLIELRVLADQDHVTSLHSLYKCNADMTDDLRKAIYAGIAQMNICLSLVGLLTTM